MVPGEYTPSYIVTSEFRDERTSSVRAEYDAKGLARQLNRRCALAFFQIDDSKCLRSLCGDVDGGVHPARRQASAARRRPLPHTLPPTPIGSIG